jgi:hypothetical protein
MVMSPLALTSMSAPLMRMFPSLSTAILASPTLRRKLSSALRMSYLAFRV